jgi:hypothetical protein
VTPKFTVLANPARSADADRVRGTAALQNRLAVRTGRHRVGGPQRCRQNFTMLKSNLSLVGAVSLGVTVVPLSGVTLLPLYPVGAAHIGQELCTMV